MLIPFPIAALAGALLVDLAYLGTGDAFWVRMSMWLLGTGVILGALAGLVGYMDFSKIPRARQQRVGWAHAVGNSMVIVLALINWALRLNDPIGGLVPWGVALSTICVIGLMLPDGSAASSSIAITSAWPLGRPTRIRDVLVAECAARNVGRQVLLGGPFFCVHANCVAALSRTMVSNRVR